MRGIKQKSWPEAVGFLLALAALGVVGNRFHSPVTRSDLQVGGWVTACQDDGRRTLVTISDAPAIRMPQFAFHGGVGGGTASKSYEIDRVVSLPVGERVALNLNCEDRWLEARPTCSMKSLD